MYRLEFLLLLESKFEHLNLNIQIYLDWGDTFSNQMNLVITCFEYRGYSEYESCEFNFM